MRSLHKAFLAECSCPKLDSENTVVIEIQSELTSYFGSLLFLLDKITDKCDYANLDF